MDRMSIARFCEEFDQVDGERTIAFITCDKNETSTIQFVCRKRNIEFWAGVDDKGIRYFVEGTDITSTGIFCEAVECIKEEDSTSVDYDIYDASGTILFYISIFDY